MNGRRFLKVAGAGIATTAAVAAAGYAGLVVFNRLRYGTVEPFAAAGKDPLLDQFLPSPEVAEHHQIDIAAPAAVVMATAKEFELMESPVVRAIIAARALALGGEPDSRVHPTRLIEQMESIGWVVLAEVPGRQIVVGSVTQPWEAAPVFRSVAPAEFHAFAEPGYVKIAWTLRAEPIDGTHSTFHTETRVSTTSRGARERFKAYWSFVAPGVELIRLAMLKPLRRAAEARVTKSAA